jgi:hypothetical protein
MTLGRLLVSLGCAGCEVPAVLDHRTGELVGPRLTQTKSGILHPYLVMCVTNRDQGRNV